MEIYFITHFKVNKRFKYRWPFRRIMRLTDIVKQGQRLGMALLMAGSLSCVSAPIFQAKRDYQAYPKYRKDIAMYNIKNILEQNCSHPTIDEEGFTCEWASCAILEAGGRYSTNRYLSTSYDSNWECLDKQVDSRSFRWDEIQTVGIGAGGSCLEINNKGCATVPVGNRRQGQLQELVEAINIYLQETRTARPPADKPGYIK